MDIFTEKKVDDLFRRVYVFMQSDEDAKDPLHDKVSDAFADDSQEQKAYESAQQARRQLIALLGKRQEQKGEYLLDLVFSRLSDLDYLLCKQSFRYGYLAGQGKLEEP